MDKDFTDLLLWLERIGGAKVTDSLLIGRSVHGSSLFATKVIHAGECIMKIPYKAVLSIAVLPRDISVYLSNKVSEQGMLAAVLMNEMLKGQDSRWFPYISQLPQPTDMHSTIFWSEDELSMIPSGVVYTVAKKHIDVIEKEFSLVAPVFKKHYPGVTKGLDLEDFKYAYALVKSRAWDPSEGSYLMLLPFADLMNHSELSKISFKSDDDTQLVQAIADRNYSPGEEVRISYGDLPNYRLMTGFGFTLPHNIHDEYYFPLQLPKGLPLYNMKLGLLRRIQNIHIVDKGNIDHNGIFFDPIKEVKSFEGNDTGVLLSLRAFGRIVCCTSPQELDDLEKEAAQNGGPLAQLPLKDRRRELGAHKMIMSCIIRVINKHSACIKEIDATNHHFVRRQMLKDVASGELRILKSAAVWLEHYCKALVLLP